MWKQYRKTFTTMQVFIALVTLAMSIWSRAPALGAVFFVVMQVGALLGAAWGTRLDRRLRRNFALPPSS